MRLLHSKTLELREFMGSEIPAYAILSHRWEHEEVTFADMQAGQFRSKRGFDKIEKCCRQAVSENLEFVWVDTCCIDKSSSAELSEAINSMYQWYQSATVCYAYLSDVNHYDASQIVPGANLIDSGEVSVGEFKKSLWFTRGWTLQELIAPAYVVFFANGQNGWVQIGAKSSLAGLLAECTGIHAGVLLGQDVRECSIAMRMSWAAQRVTTRVEDIAYCLLGIFNVNMPLLYGEGDFAFIRLQEEIMKRSDDQSLFAWDLSENWATSGLSGLLAASPSDFRNSASVFPLPDPDSNTPYAMTNRGIQVEFPIVDGTGKDARECLAVLQCTRQGSLQHKIAIPLFRLTEQPSMHYARQRRNDGQLLTLGLGLFSKAIKRIVFVKQDRQERSEKRQWRDGVFVRLHVPYLNSYKNRYMDPHITHLQTDTSKYWNQYFLSPPPHRRGAFIFLGADSSEIAVLFDLGSLTSPKLLCKAFLFVRKKDIGGQELPGAENYWEQQGLLQSVLFQLDPRLGVSRATVQQTLRELFKHLTNGGCSQSFAYLPGAIRHSILVELKPDIIRGQEMFVLDIRIESQNDDASFSGPYELEVRQHGESAKYPVSPISESSKTRSEIQYAGQDIRQLRFASLPISPVFPITESSPLS